MRPLPDVQAFLPPPYGITVLNISITHHSCATNVHQAAQRPGATATRRDRDKFRGIEGHALEGQTYVPASVETYGYLGKSLVQFLSQLSEVAAQRTLGLTKGCFLASAYRELSFALVRGQKQGCNACAKLLARASGSEFVEGVDTPYIDYVLAGIWLCLASRFCISLFCSTWTLVGIWLEFGFCTIAVARCPGFLLSPSCSSFSPLVPFPRPSRL
jgi:hypothetical protein